MIRFDQFKKLDENSLYTNQAEKDALVNDKTKLMDAFYINFLMFLGLFATWRTAGIKQYEQSEGKLYINNIDDTNHDVSLVIKLLFDQGILQKSIVDRMTKLLVKIKGNQIKYNEIDETLIRQIINDMHYTSHRGSVRIMQLVTDFASGSLDLRRLAYKMFKLTRANEYAGICTEVRNIGKFYGQLFKKFGLDQDPNPVNNQVVANSTITSAPAQQVVSPTIQQKIADGTIKPKTPKATVNPVPTVTPGIHDESLTAIYNCKTDDDFKQVLKLYSIKKPELANNILNVAAARNKTKDLIDSNSRPIYEYSAEFLKIFLNNKEARVVLDILKRGLNGISLESLDNNAKFKELISLIGKKTKSLSTTLQSTLLVLSNNIWDKPLSEENIPHFVKNITKFKQIFAELIDNTSLIIVDPGKKVSNYSAVKEISLETFVAYAALKLENTYNTWNFETNKSIYNVLKTERIDLNPGNIIALDDKEKFANDNVFNAVCKIFKLNVIAEKNVSLKLKEIDDISPEVEQAKLYSKYATGVMPSLAELQDIPLRSSSAYYITRALILNTVPEWPAAEYMLFRCVAFSDAQYFEDFIKILAENPDKNARFIKAGKLAISNATDNQLHEMFSRIRYISLNSMKTFLQIIEDLPFDKLEPLFKKWECNNLNISLIDTNLPLAKKLANLLPIQILLGNGDANSASDRNKNCWEIITGIMTVFSKFRKYISENDIPLNLVGLDNYLDNETIKIIAERSVKAYFPITLGPKVSLAVDEINKGIFDSNDSYALKVISTGSLKNDPEKEIKRILKISDYSKLPTERIAAVHFVAFKHLDDYDWGSSPSVDFKTVKDFINSSYTNLVKNGITNNARDKAAVKDNIQRIFLKVQDHYTTAQIDELFNSLETPMKKILFKDMLDLGISHAISSGLGDNSPIKPDRKLSDSELLTILKINGVNISGSVKIKATDLKGDTYAEVKQNVENSIKSSGNFIEEQKLSPITLSDEELEKQSITLNKKYNKYRHGNTALLIKKVWSVSIPSQQSEYPSYNGVGGVQLTQLGPQFHGTQPIPAAMISRFGFKVITQDVANKAGIRYAGRMLGDGIYMSNVIDKCAQYMDPSRAGTGISRRRGVLGYLFEMDAQGSKWIANLDNGQGDWATGGGVMPGEYYRSLVSPEWAVKNESAQCRIYKCYEVEIIDKSDLLTIAKKHKMNESYLEFLEERAKPLVKEANYTTFTFMDGSIPVSYNKVVEAEKFVAAKFGDNVLLDWSSRGPVVMIKTDEAASHIILHTPQFIANHTLLRQYLELLNESKRNF